ncbi:hypothetical protein [Parasedimentitalea huanghaiensis]|uniref:hypothetical protein n=1 Tax=Parasedimentitalea huanghaiensis TaxID=2682100 RepID=UPI001FD84B58|nr:hypothetical protein [Zongyanglinia huanghaiensis]
MTTWSYNSDGTISFNTNDLGTITVGVGHIVGTPLEGINTNHVWYHEYDEISSLGIPVGSISEQFLYDSLAAYPTPFGPDFAGPGWVTHEQISDTMIVNYTATSTVLGIEVPAHGLTPGLVVREIIEVDGVYAIRTYGMGQGVFPSLNEDLADAVWTYADSVLVDDLVNRAGISIFDAMTTDESFVTSYVGRQFIESTARLIVENAGIGSSALDTSNAATILSTSIRAIILQGGDVTTEDLAAIVARMDELVDAGLPVGWGATVLFREIYDTYNAGNGTNFDSCFGPEVPIDMWPIDPDLKPGPDGIYDQDEVLSKVWKKPIELIEVGDIVMSFDENDNLVPGPVTRTFQNDAKILLNFHGTRVTPGHVYYRPDSKKSYKYEMLIDVLRDDGVIKHQDGTLIRAATNVAVDDPRDGFVKAVAGNRKTDGTFEQLDEGRIRLGTRFLVGRGKERKSWSAADLIALGGGVVGDDELIRVGEGEPLPFLWDFGETLPKPEDFVLASSGTTLEDIYKAAEWESQGPRLAAPMVLDRGPVQPLKGAALSAMPRNEPLEVVHSLMASVKPKRTLNRKQRKAKEVQRRKSAKSRKQVAL